MRGNSRLAGAIIALEEGHWCTQAGLDKTATVQQLRSHLAKLSSENWLPPAKLLWIEELLSGSPSLVSIHGQNGSVHADIVNLCCPATGSAVAHVFCLSLSAVSSLLLLKSASGLAICMHTACGHGQCSGHRFERAAKLACQSLCQANNMLFATEA